jgi:hypothetical protein
MTPLLSGGLAVICLVVCSWFSLCLEEKHRIAEPGLLLHGASMAAEATANPSSHHFQRISEDAGQISAEYGFLNINGDALSIKFSTSAQELAAYKREYGYTKADLAALKEWQQKAYQEVYQKAESQGLSQSKCDEMIKALNVEYNARYRELFLSRGFAFTDDGKIMVDVPSIARRNVKNLHPVAMSFAEIAKDKGYDPETLVSAIVSLVQTSIQYESVPLEIEGRKSGGLYPPMEAMARGRGDCDTKTTLLASILLSWDKVRTIGVAIPQHYLMGILHSPAKGDAFIEYKGLTYVLVEATGPAWLPAGSVGPLTTSVLAQGLDLRIQPMSAN